MHDIPDVDLDVKYRERAVKLFPQLRRASEVLKGNLVPHMTGVYFQNIPVDPVSGLSAFPYDVAEQLGFYKIDLIANHVYDHIIDEEHLQELLDAPTDWSCFQDKRFFTTVPGTGLSHLGNYQWLCKQYPPTSVEDVAALIAVIRPMKRYLIGQPWAKIREVIWKRLPEEEAGYFFKKSHAIAFALLVTVHAKILARSMKTDTGS